MKKEERKRNKDGTYMCEDSSLYIGKKYGKLKILDIYPYGKRNLKKCKCICDCGNIKHVYLSNLKRGLTKSCGCIRKNSEYNTIIGKRFGKLVVIEELDKSARGQVKYKCHCDCGNSIEVYGSNLLYNQTKSCGCIRKICFYNDTIFSTNTSGVRGVHYRKGSKKWTAKLIINSKTYKKEFVLFENAVKKRKKLEEKYHKSFRDEYIKLKESIN